MKKYIAIPLVLAISGCSKPVPKDINLVDDITKRYASADIEGKEKILNERLSNTYHSRNAIKLIRFDYDYPWKGNERFGKIEVGIEGGIGAYYIESKKYPETNLEIENYSQFGLEIPKGYSVLFVRKASDESKIPLLVDGIEKFGEKHPELKIDNDDIDGLRQGLERIYSNKKVE